MTPRLVLLFASRVTESGPSPTDRWTHDLVYRTHSESEPSPRPRPRPPSTRQNYASSSTRISARGACSPYARLEQPKLRSSSGFLPFYYIYFPSPEFG
ncbi:hypothetical protein CVT25_003281 [Psilocybe cyanescens]|uniref:Uncharacterized protein n=1 Tax=Psilocybe cyanescens TaxID=93625 RepID=A0A409WMG1_PSICY|nr:hypothetical protein CVT25_003281 [Psilocybe cyanescens]